MHSIHLLQKHRKGFTLAELLVCLVILGEIATFTIPKILSAQQNATNKAVFKETIATLNAVIYQGMQIDGMTANNVGTYIRGHMNAIKICNSNSSTEGCWDAATQGTSNGNYNQPGIVLPNGATVVGLDDCCGNGFGGMAAGEAQNDFLIDVNGSGGPNLIDQDQFQILACFGTTPCTVWMTGSPGRISMSAAAQAFF